MGSDTQGAARFDAHKKARSDPGFFLSRTRGADDRRAVQGSSGYGRYFVHPFTRKGTDDEP